MYWFIDLLIYLFILFYTYWDFRIESIAWKTQTEIFSSNHSRESTFSHVGKAVSSNQKSAVRMNQSVRKRIQVVFGASSIFIHRSLKSFHKFTQVFSKICHKPQTKFEQVYRFRKKKKKAHSGRAEQKDSDKNPMGREVSLLSEFLNRRKRQKVLKKGNMP